MKIKGKPYKAAYKLGSQLLKHYYTEDGQGGICAYGVVNAQGEEDHEHVAPCHAGLNHMNVTEKSLVVDMTYPIRGEVDNRIAKRWIRYILEKSPFRSVFAEEHINAGWRRGYYIFDADADANLLAACLVAVRSVSEYPKIPVMFDKLVRAGTDADMAFFAAYMTGVNKDGTFFLNMDTKEGHVAMVPSWFDAETLKNFIECNHEEYGTYAEKNKYGNFNTMWLQERTSEDWDCIGVKPINNIPDVLNKLWKPILDKEGGFDNRIALFNHAHNQERDRKRNALKQDKALPLFAQLLNNYRGELYA